MGCYYTLYLNTYGYSLLFYKVYHEEGECQQLEFWLEKCWMLGSGRPLRFELWGAREDLPLPIYVRSPCETLS